MKVSCVTQRLFVGIVAAALFAAGCHRSRPDPTTGLRLDPRSALATPPMEHITLHFAVKPAAARASVRQTLFNVGIQVDSENRKAGWMRAPMGGVWDGQLYKQWFIVASYYQLDSATTVVVLRGVEQANSYLATQASRYGGPGVVATAGSARVGLVSDATQGSARNVWIKMEQVAFMLGELGAERTTIAGR